MKDRTSRNEAVGVLWKFCISRGELNVRTRGPFILNQCFFLELNVLPQLQELNVAARNIPDWPRLKVDENKMLYFAPRAAQEPIPKTLKIE
jgi:hypothetical protein